MVAGADVGARAFPGRRPTRQRGDIPGGGLGLPFATGTYRIARACEESVTVTTSTAPATTISETATTYRRAYSADPDETPSLGLRCTGASSVATSSSQLHKCFTSGCDIVSVREVHGQKRK